MKTLFRQLLYVSLLATSILSCKHNVDPEPEKSKIVFWSSNEAIKNIKVDCYVDGKKIGTLTKISDSSPNCGDSKSPVASVESGTHYCEFKAANGQTIEVELETEGNQCYNVELL